MEIETKTPKIRVCIRKRPVSKKEESRKEKDIIKVEKDSIVVYEDKQRLDLSKYTEKHGFEFDNVFSENVSNIEIYNMVIRPILHFALEGGKSSCFAYG